MAARLAVGGSPPGLSRTTSLPIAVVESMHGGDAMHVPRSHSAPELLEAGDAHGAPTPDVTPAVVVQAAEEVSATCRICMDDLQEGAQDTLRLGCHCRGELAIAHRECAVKWFSDRDSMMCEICNHRVMNLRSMDPPTLRFIRVWRHQPVLLILSMIVNYVFFLLFLMDDIEYREAFAISLPFACIHSLLGSMAAAIMVRRRYTWVYAVVEFILVVFIAYAFRYSRFHLTAVINALLATVVGFGGPMCLTYVFWRWRG